MLERLNGKSVSKAFSDKKFADIHYIRSMMLEVQATAVGTRGRAASLNYRTPVAKSACVHCRFSQHWTRPSVPLGESRGRDRQPMDGVITNGLLWCNGV